MNLQENISRVKELMGIIIETREGLMTYLKNKSKEITGIDWPEYVLRDWLYRNTKEVGEMEPSLYKNLVSNYLESFVEGHGKGHWEYKTLDISLDSFTEFVKNDLSKKMEGFINPHIPKDEKRHDTQQSQIEKQGVSPEPIIVIQTKDGKYELQEGWHRTVAALKKFGRYKQNAWVYIVNDL